MCSPMYELPEHLMMAVNVNGDGPRLRVTTLPVTHVGVVTTTAPGKSIQRSGYINLPS